MASDESTKTASSNEEVDDEGGMTKYGVSPSELTKEATVGLEGSEDPRPKKPVKKKPR